MDADKMIRKVRLRGEDIEVTVTRKNELEGEIWGPRTHPSVAPGKRIRKKRKKTPR